jgi:hypothetical protein
VRFDSYNSTLPGLAVPVGGESPQNTYRVDWIRNELGGVIQPVYVFWGAPCTLPNDWINNTLSCYPAYITNAGGQSGFRAWNRWVVMQVREKDMLSGQPDVVTSYSYIGNPAWHYTSDLIQSTTTQTYDEWRGYGQVRVTRGGVGSTAPQTSTLTTFYRGMYDDCVATGLGTCATLGVGQLRGNADATGVAYVVVNGDWGAQAPSIADREWLRGRVLEARVENADRAGGVESATLSAYTTLPASPSVTQAAMTLPYATTARQFATSGPVYTFAGATYYGDGTVQQRYSYGRIQTVGWPTPGFSNTLIDTVSDAVCDAYTYYPTRDAPSAPGTEPTFTRGFVYAHQTYRGSCGSPQVEAADESFYDQVNSYTGGAVLRGNLTRRVTGADPSPTFNSFRNYDASGRVTFEYDLFCV